MSRSCCATIQPNRLNEGDGTADPTILTTYPTDLFEARADAPVQNELNLSGTPVRNYRPVACREVTGAETESVALRTDYADSANCDGSNTSQQWALAEFYLRVCDTANATFLARVNAERHNSHFDYVRVILRRLDNETKTWVNEYTGSELLFCGGTDELLECEMGERCCCVAKQLPPGLYFVWVRMTTGDGLYHVGAWGEFTLSLSCANSLTCPVSDCEDNEDSTNLDEPPDPPAPPDLDPPFGPAPGPGQPPTPGYRGVCRCDNCNLIGIGVEISGLPNDTCNETLGCAGGVGTFDVETEMLHSALNGGYILSLNNATGDWEQLLGTQGDPEDPGLIIGRQTHTPDQECSDDGKDSFTWETAVWKISGTLTCQDCTVGGEAGVEWIGTIKFHTQCRQKTSSDAGFFCPSADTWCMGSQSCLDRSALCPNNYNQLDSNLVEQICEVPPGCNGSVTYDNGGSSGMTDDDVNCELPQCGEVLPAATLKMEPIGTTVLCT